MLRAVLLQDLHRLIRVGLIDGDIGKGDWAVLEGEVVEARAVRRDVVVLLLLDRARDNLDLLLIEAEAHVLRLDRFFKGLVVWQEDLARTGFKDG